MKLFHQVHDRVHELCDRFGRDPKSITVVAVSKRQTVESIQKYIDFCQQQNLGCVLGENYVQEWKEKKPQLKGDFTCHGIGHIQSNKMQDAVQIFDQIQTIDSKKRLDVVVKELAKRDQGASSVSPPYPLWIQINISNDEDKSGCTAEEGMILAGEIIDEPTVRLAGVMTITKSYEHADEVQPNFKELYGLANQIQQQFSLSDPLGVSMGMSQDYEFALQEGATHIRIGSALFGERPHF